MTASLTSSIEHAIPGDYQLRALQQGWRLQRAWHRARLDLIAHVLPPAAEGLILDAANGSGIVTWKFKERRIVSADYTLGWRRDPAAHQRRPRGRGAGEFPALFSGTFTQAYLLEAIEHLGEDEGVRALREMARVCRPGGTCLITTPNYRSHWRLMELALDRWGPTQPLGDAQHVTKYDSARLRKAAAAAGWSVTRLGSFNLVAPIAGVFSARAGGWLTGVESSRLRFGGPLLFGVAGAPSPGNHASGPDHRPPLLQRSCRHRPVAEGAAGVVPCDTQILVIDDGSTDRTADLARQHAESQGDERIHVHVRPANGGKGASIRAAIGPAAGEHVVLVDADLAFGRDSIAAVLQGLHGADIAIGNRRHVESRYPVPVRLFGFLYRRHLVGLTLNALVRTAFGLPTATPSAG